MVSLISDANLLHHPDSNSEDPSPYPVEALEQTLNHTLRKPCQPVGPGMVTRLIRSKDYSSYTLWLEDYTGQSLFMLAAAHRIGEHELRMTSYSLIGKEEWVIGTVKRDPKIRKQGVAIFESGVKFMSINKTGRMQLKMIKQLRLGPTEDDEQLELTNKLGYKVEGRSDPLLYFDPRVAESSPRNCQLVHPRDQDLVLLEFGKMRENEYSLVWYYPFCGIQAFAFALLQMEVKW